MKCLCFSDSHGSTMGIRRALNMHKDAEVVFFLGDGLSDFEQFIYDRTKAYFAVRGNWDVSAILGDKFVKNLDSVSLMGYKISFTHGNYHGVKYGLDGVIKLAEDTCSDILGYVRTGVDTEGNDGSDFLGETADSKDCVCHNKELKRHRSSADNGYIRLANRIDSINNGIFLADAHNGDNGSEHETQKSCKY